MLKALFLSLAICLSLSSFAQIHLKGYKCKFYKDQVPNTMAEMYNKTDTFQFTEYGNDVENAVEDPDSGVKTDVEAGLKLCFGNYHCFKTKDSLYIYTGHYSNPNINYYEVYVPNQTVLLSVRSKDTGAVFAEKSKWLLSQIRLHRHGDTYLINEKGQTCQDPDEGKY